MGYVMTKITDKLWQSIVPQIRQGVRDGAIEAKIIENENYRPTHIIDIYKMRRGRYKNVRIWTNLNLGNGRRTDLFMTTAENQPINAVFDLFSSAREEPILQWAHEIKER